MSRPCDLVPADFPAWERYRAPASLLDTDAKKAAGALTALEEALERLLQLSTRNESERIAIAQRIADAAVLVAEIKKGGE